MLENSGDFLGVVTGMIVLTIVLHEGVHSFFFWLFTDECPEFGRKWLYSCTSAPVWYIPRSSIWVIAAAPVVLISLAGLSLLAVAPGPAFHFILFGMAANAAWSLGDVVVIASLIIGQQKAVGQNTSDATYI